MTGRRFVSVLELPFVIFYSLGSFKVGKGDRVIYVTGTYLLLWCVLYAMPVESDFKLVMQKILTFWPFG